MQKIAFDFTKSTGSFQQTQTKKTHSRAENIPETFNSRKTLKQRTIEEHVNKRKKVTNWSFRTSSKCHYRTNYSITDMPKYVQNADNSTICCLQRVFVFVFASNAASSSSSPSYEHFQNKLEKLISHSCEQSHDPNGHNWTAVPHYQIGAAGSLHFACRARGRYNFAIYYFLHIIIMYKHFRDTANFVLVVSMTENFSVANNRPY